MIEKLEKYKGKTWSQINNGSLHSYDCFCDLTTKAFRVMGGDNLDAFFRENKAKLKNLAFSNLDVHLLFNNRYQCTISAGNIAAVFSCDGQNDIVVVYD